MSVHPIGVKPMSPAVPRDEGIGVKEMKDLIQKKCALYGHPPYMVSYDNVTGKAHRAVCECGVDTWVKRNP